MPKSWLAINTGNPTFLFFNVLSGKQVQLMKIHLLMNSYTGVMDALRKIVKEDGYSGLYRGSTLGVMRSIVASGVNLTCYSSFKDYCLGIGIADSAMVDICAGMISGVATVLAANPIDVVRTRYYNQPYKDGVGVLYGNGIDAFGKVLKHEGWRGLYKGVVTHWLRLGPHFTLTFLLYVIFHSYRTTSWTMKCDAHHVNSAGMMKRSLSTYHTPLTH